MSIAAILAVAVVLLALVFVAKAVVVVRQGNAYTIERLGAVQRPPPCRASTC